MNELQSLLLRGMHGFFHKPDAEIIEEIRRGMISGEYELLYVKNSAFCLLYMPQKAFDIPQVLHFYSEEKAVTHALIGYVLDFIKSKGYNTLRAVNGSGVSDAVWTRAFRHEGWEIEPVKTVFDFKVKT